MTTTRRDLLKLGALAAAASTLPLSVWAKDKPIALIEKAP